MLDIFNTKKIEDLSSKVDYQQEQIKAYASYVEYFDGEKNIGELGAPKVLIPDHDAACTRAWQLQYTNGLAKLLAEKWQTWVVGKGMRFNATPILDISEASRDKLIETIEKRWKSAQKSRYSSHSKMENLDQISSRAAYNCYVSGDVLAIYRPKGSMVTVELIDSVNVSGCADGYTPPKDNYILEGVECDSTGRHVAYHVITLVNSEEKTIRIQAYNSRTGLRYAQLIYWGNRRIGETRGVPASIQDFEKLAKLDRYTEATVGAAELTANLVISVEHGVASTGEDIFENKQSATDSVGKLTAYGRELAKASSKVKQSTGKEAINMPTDSNLVFNKPDGEVNYNEFSESVSRDIASAEGMPYEFATDNYNSNYSSSRAAIKSFEYTLSVKRDLFSIQFLKPFYELSLWVWQTSGKINMVGLETAVLTHDYIDQESLFKCSFTGQSVPSIDPLKEAKAIRTLLGDEVTPLITYEKGTEMASNSDYPEVQAQVKKERKLAIKPQEDTKSDGNREN